MPESLPPLEELLRTRILILDGAMGTMVQAAHLSADDFGGAAYEGCNEYLTLTRPEVISNIHRAYLKAGADIIETNTFGATSVVLAEYGLAECSESLNTQAAQLAAAAVTEAMAADGRPRFVAGSMGPTTKTLSLTGGISFEGLLETYRLQALGLLKGQVDLLLIETAQDLLNVKACALGIEAAFAELGRRVPLMISGTIEPMGTTLAGQSIEALYIAVEHLRPIAVGLNCATGPDFMRDHLRALASLARCAVSCYPNAGLPDEEGRYSESPERFAAKVAEFAAAGWLNLAGGCCGTTPEHIAALSAALASIAPRHPYGQHPPAVSGLEAVFLEPQNRPLLVGERTNVIGSRRFRRLIAEGELDAASEIGRQQVRAGAQIVDVCLADPDRDEEVDMAAFLPLLLRKIKVPVMIDSTDARVVEQALRFCQGKALINSANLEDGEERLLSYANLARRYGAQLVLGTIDEQGMAQTAARKVEVAERMVGLLEERCGLRPEDLVIDPLTFPVGTGDPQYLGSAVQTLEGIRLLKRRLPECPVILGVSNISFGLPLAGREVLNAVFLYHASQAGLDYAIVNTEALTRFASIPEDERKLAEALLFATDDDHVAAFTARYREAKRQAAAPTETLDLPARLARYIVEGRRDGLTDDLKEALTQDPPLAIINGPLMAGMSEVGRLFNDRQLIVAEVLQSAEVMKAAVSFLEPFMERADDAHKGSIVLATVKGDVHDIGKNLVEIILANNGFKVHDLGIKVAPEQLIAACREHQPDMIGLSGLLVKSAQQMVATAEDVKAAGIEIPVLVGGAALTKKFTVTKIAPRYDGPVLYARDAMEGLSLANRLLNAEDRASLLEEWQKSRDQLGQELGTESESQGEAPAERATIDRTAPVFQPPDLERHLMRDYPIERLRPYLNLQMLLGRHLGLLGNVLQKIAAGEPKARELMDLIDALVTEGVAEGYLKAHGVYQFFPAQGDGDTLLIFDPQGPSRVIGKLPFPRQKSAPHLCLTDFVRARDSGVMDYVALFAVTCGQGIRSQAERLKTQGSYLKSHALQALALELTEAFAEHLHHLLRERWGFPDPPAMTMRERFIARYQGIRVSFGYPACPDLENQEVLFRLLRPEEIGIELTEGFMMEPEASVSALVFSHPQGHYFNALR